MIFSVPRQTRWSLVLVAAAAGCFFSARQALALNVERLTADEIKTLQETLQTLKPLISELKKKGRADLLTWRKLYEPLSSEQQSFLDALRALRGKDLGATGRYFGDQATDSDLMALKTQHVSQDGRDISLDTQYLPRRILEAYEQMMQAMEADLGKRLLVESGYRSPAYQLYLFIYFISNHDYSIVETNRFVALPGHSEHGYPPRQAIDFINEQGINGEYNPEEFEGLPEYKWLKQHAAEFGFVLSYPRDNPDNTAYEPWHWHYEAK